MIDMTGVYALLIGFLIMALLASTWFQFVRWSHARRTRATVAALLQQHARHFARARSDGGRVGDLYVSSDSLWFVTTGLVWHAVGFLRSSAPSTSPVGEEVCTVTQVRWKGSDVEILGVRLGFLPRNLTLYGLSAEAGDAINAALGSNLGSSGDVAQFEQVRR